jgi:hypothetical protein
MGLSLSEHQKQFHGYKPSVFIYECWKLLMQTDLKSTETEGESEGFYQTKFEPSRVDLWGNTRDFMYVKKKLFVTGNFTNVR